MSKGWVEEAEVIALSATKGSRIIHQSALHARSQTSVISLSENYMRTFLYLFPYCSLARVAFYARRASREGAKKCGAEGAGEGGGGKETENLN